MASATTTQLKSPATIAIIALSAVSAGSLRAFASVQVGPSLVVHKFRIVQQPGQRPWVSPPQETWKDREGRTQYFPLVVLTGSLKTRVEAAILQEAQQQGLITADVERG